LPNTFQQFFTILSGSFQAHFPPPLGFLLGIRLFSPLLFCLMCQNVVTFFIYVNRLAHPARKKVNADLGELSLIKLFLIFSI